MAKQLRLAAARSKPVLTKVAADALQQNIAMARIILAQPERYVGLQVEWAKSVVAKAEQTGGRLV